MEAGGDPPAFNDIPGMMDAVQIASLATKRWDWQSDKNTLGCLGFVNSTCKFWAGKVSFS